MLRFFIVLLLAGLLASACSTVKVKKVPTPTQYTVWTDAMQEQADSIEGFRFYLPRPFLNVFESFPVRTDIYLANGQVSADGKSVKITNLYAIDGFNSGQINKVPLDESRLSIQGDFILERKSATEKNSGDGKTDATGQSGQAKNTADQSDSTQQKGTDKLIKNLLAAAEDQQKQDDKQTETPGNEETPSSSQPRTLITNTGKSSVAVSNDNHTFAYQPMRGNFDIAYLPDFEEQYAIEKQEGLGTVDFSFNLGQGWSLQSFNATTDNSQLTNRIFKLLDFSIDAATQAAGGALGLAGELANQAVEKGSTILAQSASAGKDNQVQGVQLVRSQPVTLKIVVIHYAAKGLYPVIKPRELQHRYSYGLPKTNTLNIDTYTQLPKAVFASQFDPRALEKAATHTDNLNGQFTVPRYPYQYISFNTFRFLVIEKVDGNANPYQHLYDKTGTKGDAGAANSGDLSNIVNWLKQTSQHDENQAEQPKVCTEKQMRTWSNTFSKIVLQGNATNGLVLHDPVIFNGHLNGTLEVAGNYNAKQQFTSVDAIKNKALKVINADQQLKQFGCKQIKASTLLTGSMLENQFADTPLLCKGETTEEIIQCALAVPLPLYNGQLKFTFKSYQQKSNLFELKIELGNIPAISKQDAYKEANDVYKEVLAHIQTQVSRLASDERIKISVLTLSNQQALDFHINQLNKEQ